jgi:hypothetical protein
MPLQATSGAASYDAFGGGVPVVPQYIEDVFSTYLYTGTGAALTITNNIDLSTKGGLVWTKQRGQVQDHLLADTARGNTKYLSSNTNDGEGTSATRITSFDTTGYTLGTGSINGSTNTYVSWTLRKQPKFFDVVTYTGNGTAGRTIAHNLGSEPGCMIVKVTNNNGGWLVYHRSLGATKNLVLNETYAATTSALEWNNTAPTSSVFTVGTSDTNETGRNYVAYLFAHDAGGFGLTGTDNVISCGTFTTDGSGFASVNLGYEAQWFMYKGVGVGNWTMEDVMRGSSMNTYSVLSANTQDAESSGVGIGSFPQATGVRFATGAASTTYIYMAIRRGPMKVPTSATSVFGINARTGTGANATVTGGQTDDAVIIKNRGSAVASLFASRLTGTNYLVTSSTAAQVAAGTTILQASPWDVMDGVKVGTTSTITNGNGSTFINYLFKRAPSFMDVVGYTGTGSATTFSHNLGVVPELIIVKRRSSAENWYTYSSATGNTKYLYIDGTASAQVDSSLWNNTTPTSSVFTVGTYGGVNSSGGTFVAYLFATCAGVSKVGSYTGNGSTQTIDCGFGANGARFVLIKRTDSTGDWYVYDTARGMTVLTDPYWLTNSSADEAATLGSVTTVSTGFALNSTILAAINVSAATYIFLAIA